MARLPQVCAREAIRAFERVGYEVVRQRGSHIRLRTADGTRAPLTVPNHSPLKPGLLRRLLRDAAVSVDEFIALLG